MPAPTRGRAVLVAAVLAFAAALVAGCGGGAQPGGGTQPGGQPPAGQAAPAQAAPVVAGARTLDGRPLDFTAPTLDGGSLDAATLAGEPVVLWFWAPWCTICRAEAPGVAEAAADLDGEVTVLGVPGRGEVEDMQRFVADTGTGGLQHVVDADGALWRSFGVVSQPAFAFIAADGTAQVFGGGLTADQLRDAARTLAGG